MKAGYKWGARCIMALFSGVRGRYVLGSPQDSNAILRVFSESRATMRPGLLWGVASTPQDFTGVPFTSHLKRTTGPPHNDQRTNAQWLGTSPK
jgi:hypothetical protein